MRSCYHWSHVSAASSSSVSGSLRLHSCDNVYAAHWHWCHVCGIDTGVTYLFQFKRECHFEFSTCICMPHSFSLWAVVWSTKGLTTSDWPSIDSQLAATSSSKVDMRFLRKKLLVQLYQQPTLAVDYLWWNMEFGWNSSYSSLHTNRGIVVISTVK